MKAILALYCKVGLSGYCHSFEVDNVRYSITCDYANNYYEAAKHALAWNDWKCDKPITKEVQEAIRACYVENLMRELGWECDGQVNRRDYVHNNQVPYQLNCQFDLNSKRITFIRERTIAANTLVSSVHKLYIPFNDTRPIGELIDLIQ